jgi:hypothetical protein
MRIEMTADAKVAEDGVTVVIWAAGEAHDTYEQLARDLIGAGKAKEVKPQEAKPVVAKPVVPTTPLARK